MSDLTTKAEVISLAFTRQIGVAKIPDSMISLMQEKHIRPILGDDFFEAVIAAPSSYTALLPYLKMIISYYVKYYILPEIFLEIADTGVVQITGQNRSITDRSGLEMMRQTTLEMGKAHIMVLEKYLYDNQSTYPLYNYSEGASANIVIAGGIIFRKETRHSWYSQNEIDHDED